MCHLMSLNNWIGTFLYCVIKKSAYDKELASILTFSKKEKFNFVLNPVIEANHASRTDCLHEVHSLSCP